MNRRGFLRGMLALGVAPAVVSSGVLMPVRKLLLAGADFGVVDTFEVGSWSNVTFIENIYPSDYVLMRELLNSAHRRCSPEVYMT